jgi:hypothetical protein
MGFLAAVALLFQAETFKIDGPPYLVLGESAEFRLVGGPRDATPVWRLSDAPGGIPLALKSVPAWDPRGFQIRGVRELKLESCGTLSGDALICAWLEDHGSRLAAAEIRVRLGPVLRVKAWLKAVDHPRGGTARPEFFEDRQERAHLETEVNRRLRALGIEVGFAAGERVAAPDRWFDSAGRFHPVVSSQGEWARSPTLRELLRQNQPGALNVYLVRDLTWVTVQEGFGRVVTTHDLVGVGFKEGDIVLDDKADAAALAHELGHAFSLEDQKDASQRGRMMYWIRRDRTGESFTWQEMKDARERARLHLAQESPRR